MGWQDQSVISAALMIVEGSAGGMFLYSGAPGPGNSPQGWSTVSGVTTDPFGNSLPSAGVGEQGSTNWVAMLSGVLKLGVNAAGSFPAELFESVAGFLVVNSGATATAGDVPAICELKSKDAAGGVGYPALITDPNTSIVSTGGTPANQTQISTDGWNAVSNPAGVTGTIRVQLSPLASMAVLDVNATITSDLNAPTSYVTGNLPSAAYYPAAARMFPVSVNQQWSTTANASPRLLIPTSGGVSLQMPGFNAAGNACIVSATILYPLN